MSTLFLYYLGHILPGQAGRLHNRADGILITGAAQVPESMKVLTCMYHRTVMLTTFGKMGDYRRSGEIRAGLAKFPRISSKKILGIPGILLTPSLINPAGRLLCLQKFQTDIIYQFRAIICIILLLSIVFFPCRSSMLGIN